MATFRTTSLFKFPTCSAISVAKNVFKPFKMKRNVPPTFHFSKKKGLNIFGLKSFKINNFGLKSFGGKKDWDGDGVPNWKDCQPKNVMRQDFSETDTGVPVYTYPRSYGYRRRKVMMAPNKFLQLAKKGYRSEDDKNMSDKQHEAILSQSNINKLKPIIQHKQGRMTIPVLETMKGSIKDHEGRHRALAAKQLGMTEMPVYMVEAHKSFIKSKEQQKPTKAIKWEQQDPIFDSKEIEYRKSRKLGEELAKQKLPTQSAFHAGDELPSEQIKRGEPVYGFSSLLYAQGWQKAHKKKNIYQITTDDYVVDAQTYRRPTTEGKKYSDIEFIAKNIVSERRIEEDDEIKKKKD